MEQNIMVKAFGRAVLITAILLLIGFALWRYTLITCIVLILAWLFTMFYLDPPEDWN